ncbi:MAG: class I SAM-dependent RNA methyltransferase, partial [Tsuneonella sp.]
MTAADRIVGVAAKGDGVTADGRHVPLAAPGDRVLPDGSLEAGPHRAVPPCRYFPRCGGCQLQHLDEAALGAFVRDRVVLAAQGQEVLPQRVADAHLSPPCSRRRATLHAAGGRGRPQIGFREQGSHRIVDMHECHVLRPELFAFVAPLRALLGKWRGRWAADIDLAVTDQGVDVGLRNLPVEGLDQTEALLAFARGNGLARLSIDLGYGAEALWEPEPVTVTLGAVSVALPPGAFLQATADGEQALVAAAREWVGGCRQIADLFAGLGTFAFSLAGAATVTAVEGGRDACLAGRGAAA